MKPIVGTESCQIYHFGYVLSGRMKVVMDDGTVAEASAGDEPCVWLELAGADRYAMGATQGG